MMLDHISKLQPVVALAPAVVSDNSEQVFTTLDLQGCGSASLVIATGVLADADATFTLTVWESDNSTMSGNETAVAAADLIGTAAQASFDFSKDTQTFWIGYKGSKRYIRAKLAVANNSTTAPLAAVWLKGHLELAPAARN
ncbi:hypothetical protein ABAC460_23040 [Asticcacaulis sp. AC460]|uniref:hypothetical protein n=1 Tax=Asticcacaulis sp. AC460 TaxID=1282360 RepID=UPI0003C3ED77|nr:hypothetical protein [Asticcacaulis sp. AC460]ESQ86565.1 hypothetical protein ABAC460_23040 [Asticcacaulis sp. AC460]